MKSYEFVQNVQERLSPIAPIVLPGIINKQLLHVGASKEAMTPPQAERFIARMEEALETFLGPNGRIMIHQIMMKELRRSAPEYFETQSLV
jgi:hypothetical protein